MFCYKTEWNMSVNYFSIIHGVYCGTRRVIVLSQRLTFSQDFEINKTLSAR